MEPMRLRRSRNGATIVFVHGILSGPISAWKNKSGAFWPRLVFDDEQLIDFGVYLYTYRADALSGTYSLEDAVDAMRDYFRLDQVLDGEPNQLLIFVCHSMGGILARRFVVANQLELVERKTRFAFFLIASPSLGAQYANFVAAVAPLYNAQLDILRFSQTNHWLNTLDKDFLNLKEGRKLLISGRELVEDQFAAHRSFLRFKQIVPPWTGAKYFGNPIKIPGSDHMTIAKPSGLGDLQHRLLVEFVKSASQEWASQRSRRTRIVVEERPLVVDWSKILEEENGAPAVAPIKRGRRTGLVVAGISIATVLLGMGWFWLTPELGTVVIEFENATGETVKVSGQAEYYITAPETPGMNSRVDSGILRLVDASPDSSGWALEIPPATKRKAKARFANEEKVIPYYKRGDMYVEFIFSATPRPIHAEFNFDRQTFEPGIRFAIVGQPFADLPKEVLSGARVVIAAGPNLPNELQQMIASRLGDAGIIVSGFAQFEGQPNAPTSELIYYNEEDEPLADAIKLDLDQRLANPITAVKGTSARAQRGVIDIFLDKVSLKQ
ncbi:esterase/lipase family protein [Rhizobium sp.]|uniref:esterase/lipase family protein n=1 Tax=Rhizobium sp. TaxID=391 RepID=UPI003982BDF8